MGSVPSDSAITAPIRDSTSARARRQVDPSSSGVWLRARGQERADVVVRSSMEDATAVTRRGGRGKEGIDDSLLGSVNRRFEDAVEPDGVVAAFGKHGDRVPPTRHIIGDALGSGEGQDDLAAAVTRGGAGAGEAKPGALSDAAERMGVERGVGGDDDDARAFGRGIDRQKVGEMPANGDARDGEPGAPPKVREDQDADGIVASVGGDTTG